MFINYCEISKSEIDNLKFNLRGVYNQTDKVNNNLMIKKSKGTTNSSVDLSQFGKNYERNIRDLFQMYFPVERVKNDIINNDFSMDVLKLIISVGVGHAKYKQLAKPELLKLEDEIRKIKINKACYTAILKKNEKLLDVEYAEEGNEINKKVICTMEPETDYQHELNDGKIYIFSFTQYKVNKFVLKIFHEQLVEALTSFSALPNENDELIKFKWSKITPGILDVEAKFILYDIKEINYNSQGLYLINDDNELMETLKQENNANNNKVFNYVENGRVSLAFRVLRVKEEIDAIWRCLSTFNFLKMYEEKTNFENSLQVFNTTLEDIKENDIIAMEIKNNVDQGGIRQTLKHIVNLNCILPPNTVINFILLFNGKSNPDLEKLSLEAIEHTQKYFPRRFQLIVGVVSGDKFLKRDVQLSDNYAQDIKITKEEIITIVDEKLNKTKEEIFKKIDENHEDIKKKIDEKQKESNKDLTNYFDNALKEFFIEQNKNK